MRRAPRSQGGEDPPSDDDEEAAAARVERWAARRAVNKAARLSRLTHEEAALKALRKAERKATRDAEAHAAREAKRKAEAERKWYAREAAEAAADDCDGGVALGERLREAARAAGALTLASAVLSRWFEDAPMMYAAKTLVRRRAADACFRRVSFAPNEWVRMP